MRVLLHGAGREVQAAARYFASQAATEVALFDDGGASLPGLRSLNMAEAGAFVQRATYLRSPGIPPTNELVKAASSAAEVATTPTGYWLAKEAPTGTVTITGTKGKSTTSALSAAVLMAAGLSAKAYGNIGAPPLDHPLPGEAHPVVELSSYMMHDVPLTEHLHVITCLFEDHLDWHGTKAAYHEAKLRPFRQASPAPGLAPQDVIDAKGLPPSVRAIGQLVRDTGTGLFIGSEKIDAGPVDRGFTRGPLRRALQTAAAVALQFLEAPAAARAASEAASSFEGLPYRQQIVPSSDGRTWVDDSLATIPEATIAAASRFAGRPVVLVLGGADRGIDYAPLQELFGSGADVQAVAYGPAAARMPTEAQRRETLEDAIEEARRLCPQGGVILFAPAAPSSAPHRDYQERSAVFRSLALANA